MSVELAASGSKVWGVDPSEEMLAEARRRAPRSVEFRRARAEALPFRSGWFERVLLRLVVHLVDRAHALPELGRVLAPGGRIVVATFRPEHFDGIWLAPYFPSVARLDRARFPDPGDLERELREAGFESVRTRTLSQAASIGREEALERIRGRYISTLSLLSDDEFEAGLERASLELGAETAYSLEWAVLVAACR